MRLCPIAFALAAAFLYLGPLAEAQTVNDPLAASTMPRVNLTAEQRHVIKEIVLKDLNVAKTTAQVSLSIGASVPDGVSLQPFPPEIGQKVPQIKAHEFFVKDGSVVIVSPKDHTIAEVIE
jgi:Protein of unknown function (DUF1236)